MCVLCVPIKDGTRMQKNNEQWVLMIDKSARNLASYYLVPWGRPRVPLLPGSQNVYILMCMCVHRHLFVRIYSNMAACRSPAA